LTFDLDLQSQTSYSNDPYPHKGQSVEKIDLEWKQTNEQIDANDFIARSRQDYDGRDCHLTPSNNLLKLTCLATETHGDSIEFICAMQKTFMYVCTYMYLPS